MAAAGLLAATPGSASARPLADRGLGPGTITTIAGGTGGPGPAGTVGMDPCAVTYAGGSLYVADTFRNLAFVAQPSLIRQISVVSGKLTTLAGDGDDPWTLNNETAGLPPAPDGSAATSAGITASCGVATDQHGNVLLSDSTDYTDGANAAAYGIRVVAKTTGTFYGRHMTRGRIYTIVRASDPLFGSGWAPGAIAVDNAGNVLFTSADNHVYALAARSGMFYGQRMRAGLVYSVAGGGKRLGDGGPASRASLSIVPAFLTGPLTAGLRVDHHGNLVVADTGHCRIRVIAGKSGDFYDRAMRAGYIYTIAGNGTCRLPLGAAPAHDGELATRAELSDPAGLAVDHAGNLVITDGSFIRVVATSAGRFHGRAMQRGHIYTIAGNTSRVPGNGGPARLAGFIDPRGLSVDGSGNVIIADLGSLRVIAARSGTYYGQPMRAGYVYAISGPDGAALDNTLFSGDGGPATRAELEVGAPYNGGLALTPLALEPSGDLLIAEQGEVRLLAVRAGALFGLNLKAGYLYRIAGDGKLGRPRSGGLATGEAAGANAIATDASGNVLLASGWRVQVVAAADGTFYGHRMLADHIYTIAGDGQSGESGDGGPATKAAVEGTAGVAVDSHGNVLITAECVLRVVAAVSGTFYGQPMTAGDIYTIAGDSKICGPSGDGGPAVQADLTNPASLRVDRDGNIVISSDSGIRVIAAATGTFYGQPMMAGDIYTIMPVNPGGFTIDGSGNLILTNAPDGSVSVVAESTGTFYGQAMTAGDTYQIAGASYAGDSGDGGPAARASLLEPLGVVATPAGDVIIAGYLRIREIAG
jgi:trimeric autotransporter adhesin